MIKKKKILKIEPQFYKDKNGKTTEVFLNYKTYESIIKEIYSLKNKIAELKKKK